MAFDFQHVPPAPVSPLATEHMVSHARRRAAGDRRVPAPRTWTARPRPSRGEAVRADGEVAGYVAAGGYGHCLGRAIALAYLPRHLVEAETRLEIDLLGEHVPAVAGAPPL
jgi:glycine cleavage system aminomethyltransferase T